MKTQIFALALVASLVTACGSSNNSSVSPIVALSTSSSSGGTTASGALQFALSTTSLSEGQTINLAATGGIPPYYYCIQAGYGCSLYAPDMGSINNINPTSPTYTSPNVAETVTLEVIDSSGGFSAPATVSLTVGAGGSSGSSGTITNPQPLVLSPSSGTYTVNQPITLTTTGGTPNYTYSITGGAGGSFMSQTPNQVVFVAPSTAGTVTIQVTDQSSLAATATFNVVTVNGLTITPGKGSVGTGQTLPFQGFGGSGNYTFSAASNFGSFNGSVYFAPAVPGTATITMKDTTSGQSVTTSLTVTATYSTSQFTSSFQLLADQFAGITFDNDPTAGPSFEIFGTNPNRDADSVGTDGNGVLLCGGNTAPCVVNVPLSNWGHGAPVTYRGTISLAGRSGTSFTIGYCIPPSNTSLAYLNQNPSSVQTYAQVAFNGDGNTLFGGDLTETFFALIDPGSGQGYANVDFSGGFTANTDCSDVGTHFVQVDN